MSTRDSGIIDLFAIQEQCQPAPPSAPPPAVSFDTGAGADDLDDDLEAFSLAQRQSAKRAKIIGGVVGALALLGVVAIGVGASSKVTPETKAAATAIDVTPPAATQAEPPPVVDPAPAPAEPTPAPPPTAAAKPDYTPQTAAAAYAGSQAKAKAKKAPARKVKKSRGGGVKLQKVQSSGT